MVSRRVDGLGVVGDGRRAGPHDDEDGLSALEANLDGGALELVGDLGRRVGQGVHQGEAGGGVESETDPLCGLLGLRTHRPGRLGEIPTQCVDVLGDVHAHHHDTIMVSRQHHDDAGVAQGRFSTPFAPA